jgi:hypothetical protein
MFMHISSWGRFNPHNWKGGLRMNTSSGTDLHVVVLRRQIFIQQ